jgi:1-deoxy-D-xylulose-5-phosphate synthase
MQALEVGKAQLRRKGRHVALLAFGTLVEPAWQLAEELDFTLVNMRFVKPLDTGMIDSITATHELIVTLEENAIPGGAGAGVVEYLSSSGSTTTVKLIGLPDEFVEHGSREELLSYCRLDLDGLRDQIKALVKAEPGLREVG